jgi:hypothetical protein
MHFLNSLGAVDARAALRSHPSATRNRHSCESTRKRNHPTILNGMVG